MAKKIAKKVLLIGWDAADWKVIHPLIDAGQLPALEKLINQGVMGNIATLDPPSSPMLWTSIATGKTADKHGILGFIEPDPNTGDIRPVLSTSRKVKAIWNILTEKGYKTHTVGYWPSHPAEPINGIALSDFYAKSSPEVNGVWPSLKGSVHPPHMEDFFSGLRVHPGEITEAHILPFVPRAAEIDQEKDKMLPEIAKMIAHASSIHSATTWILENEEWDFLAVYYNDIDHFCHGFMKYHPPQLPGIPDRPYELYKDVVNSAYRFHDMMLERLIELAGEDTTIVLLSDHGFHSDHLRPKRLPNEPAGQMSDHSPYGIICMKGPGIKKDERITGATLLDITPTLLTLFGLPVGSDMDGKALVQSLEEQLVPEMIESWENTGGECGMHPAEKKRDPLAEKEAMDQLIALGYIEPLSEDKEQNVIRVTMEMQFYLARALMHAGRYEQALPVLEKLYAEHPEALRFGLRLANCYLTLRKIDDCRKTLLKLRETDPETKDLPQIDLTEGTLLMYENKPRKALEALLNAEKKMPHFPHLYNQLGNVYLKMQKWKEAERPFIKALSIDENNAHAHFGLGLSYLRQNKTWDAIDELLSSLGLIFHNPSAHYHLGEALLKAGEPQRAVEAFKVTIRQSPGYTRAHQWLEHIYQEILPDAENAKFHREFIQTRIKGTVTIVCGLQRSGTSLIMQMLEAGGVQVMKSDHKPADIHNPKGYYELSEAQLLAQGAGFLKHCTGKAVKVYAHFLPHLPPDYNYKIIYIHRDVYEIIKSQNIMGGNTGAAHFSTAQALENRREKALGWIRQTPGISLLELDYREVVNHPEIHAESIASFMESELNIHDMTMAVDKSLYRQKSETVTAG